MLGGQCKAPAHSIAGGSAAMCPLPIWLQRAHQHEQIKADESRSLYLRTRRTPIAASFANYWLHAMFVITSVPVMSQVDVARLQITDP
eukprot:1592565-Amphidinium_carterae.1